MIVKLTFKTITALLCSSFLSACAPNSQQLAALPAVQENKARNVILFIGDGMGVSTVTAVRILDGQLKGGYGEENILAWEKFPHVALSKTYNTNQQVPDSAGTATAFMTGVKTKAGFINVREEAIRGTVHPLSGTI
ncbi:MAG: alkaline phosphatase [Opitutaceae bacterium]|nr:alkaline phosphatase [Opitutaceae bacterium]